MINVVFTAAGVMILAACLGLLRFGERDNIVYARVHIAGVIDVACIIVALAMGYPLVGLTYLVLVPLSAHAIANAHHRRRTSSAGGGR